MTRPTIADGLSSADFDTAEQYARLHRLAGFGTRGRGAGASHEVDKPIEVSLDPSLGAKSFFSGLSHAKIVRLWDAVFDDDGVAQQTADARAAAAARTTPNCSYVRVAEKPNTNTLHR